jgi:2,3-bisphosphoglycerate-dependent phosphoglycerate mutase
MIKLVLVRHGQSQWNLENKFTGWTDVELSEQGVREAIAAGDVLSDGGYRFDIAYTSVLKRANDTLDYILEVLDQNDIPVVKSWRLNERHYGALQGLNKKETADKYGDEQVHIWRRSYDVQPPKLSEDDERNPANIEQYKNIDKSELPLTESLKDTVHRVVPYFNEVIVPDVKKGKKIIVVAHGNSIRALVKYLDKLSDEEIVDVDIPNAVPLVYEFNENFEAIKNYYLGDEEVIKEKIQKIKKMESIHHYDSL